ncbi:hypothetical protein ANCDUO_06399 [Ancylostoma duodenale]|uniref:Uncharacterized protein n=1 Tax=Ancylostoma duodenale TaxID=51022 RepID=A0A0C2GW76_9BILA|nr:hypothetical protein ANCDUO_06399 [Ancylostoma duodenale]
MRKNPSQGQIPWVKMSMKKAANPANTLDGLVARRADDTHEPFQKRYLSEQEAIEGPDDEVEAKVSCYS